MLLSFDADYIPQVRLIGRVSYKDPWIHFTRISNEYILFVIKSGELYIEEDSRKFALKKGDTLLLKPNVIHRGYREACCEYYYVHFQHQNLSELENTDKQEIIQEMLLKRRQSLTGDFLSSIPPTDSISYFPKQYHINNENEILHILKEVMDEYYNRFENYKKLVSCRFMEVLIRLCREYASSEIETQQDHFSKTFIKARSILNYINKDYYKKITSEEIEQLFESNYDYLNRVFNKISGYSIFNYLNMVRIDKAKELIETTPVKFSEIGYLVGIDDPYYFSKLFKKYTGMSPSQYLKRKNMD